MANPCIFPDNISVIYGGGTITASWEGASALYRLRYRLDGAPLFTELQGPTASFSFAATVGKLYDLELVNVCASGVEVIERTSYLAPETALPILNFRIVAVQGRAVTVQWDSTLVAKPYWPVLGLVGWQGQIVENNYDEVPAAQTQYTYLIPPEVMERGDTYSGHFALQVQQGLNDYQNRESVVVYAALCNCAATTPAAGTGGDTNPPPQPDVADLNYVFTQAVPQAVWNVTHNLGFHPAVNTTDENGQAIDGVVVYGADLNSLTIHYSQPVAGTAVMS